MKGDMLERDLATRRIGHWHGIIRRFDFRLGVQQLAQALGGAGRALQVAEQLGERAQGTGDDHGIEHESR